MVGRYPPTVGNTSKLLAITRHHHPLIDHLLIVQQAITLRYRKLKLTWPSHLLFLVTYLHLRLPYYQRS